MFLPLDYNIIINLRIFKVLNFEQSCIDSSIKKEKTIEISYLGIAHFSSRFIYGMFIILKYKKKNREC